VGNRRRWRDVLGDVLNIRGDAGDARTLVALPASPSGYGVGQKPRSARRNSLQRLDWLDRTLAEKPDAPTLIAMHHPPFRCGIAHMDAIVRTGIDLVRRRDTARAAFMASLEAALRESEQNGFHTLDDVLAELDEIIADEERAQA